MRIIAGKYKSRILKFPHTKTIRPTMDRVRETLFNVIGNNIEGVRVLDLFAGCGSLGYEALSRGARYVCFVDNHRAAVECIKENSVLLHVEQSVKVVKMGVLRIIPLLPQWNERFDYVFLDPPYGSNLAKKTLMKLYQFDILAPHGKVIVEHGAHDIVPMAENMQITACKEFGETNVTFLMRTSGA